MPNDEAVFDGEVWYIEKDGVTLALEQSDGLGLRVEFEHEADAKRYIALVRRMIEEEGMQP